MSFSIKLGNFLYKNAFGLYKPMYKLFKNKQDAFEIELLKKHIKQNDTVLDIGANIGFYATILSDIVGEKGLVHCFEPDSKNFEHLKKTTADFKNIKINNKAVGPKTEKLKIYTSKNLNVDHRTYKPEEYDKEIEIDAVSIDDHLATDPKVDFIKMDIQGSEIYALKGMENLLIKNKPWMLLENYDNENDKPVIEYLLSLGYTIYRPMTYLPNEDCICVYNHTNIEEFLKNN